MENSVRPTSASAYTPKPIADLIADFSGVTKATRSVKGSRQTSRPLTVAAAVEKFQPLPIAEILKTAAPVFLAGKTNRATPKPTDKKNTWNSSVKIDRRISHFKNGQLKTSTARKVLDFQPILLSKQNFRVTTLPAETPTFIKPQCKVKKSIHLAAKSNLTRISGVCKIQNTPQETSRLSKITKESKENIPSYINKNIPSIMLSTREQCNKNMQPPTVIIHPPTPVKNDLWKSSCDDSFLKTEKKLQHILEKESVIAAKEETCPNIAEISPPNATPFNDYRPVADNLDNTEDTAGFDDTIMIFDKSSTGKNIKEESIITSLCDLLKNTLQETSEISKITKESEENIQSYTNKYIPSITLSTREQCNKNMQPLTVNIHQPTPVKNDLWKSIRDDSFLETEKKLQHILEKESVIAAKEEPCPNIAEISPPNATPFNDYRPVTHNLDNTEDTAVFEDTIMIFDKPSATNNIKEERTITSLCDLLKNASVQPNKTHNENNGSLTVLLQATSELERTSIMIDNMMQTITSIKHSHTKCHQCIKRLIKEKINVFTNDAEITLLQENTSTPIKNKFVPKAMTHKSPTISPSYKIPKKNSYLKKKGFHKSMPHTYISEKSHSPNSENIAIDMYMKLKNKMNFLQTPVRQTRPEAADTPVVMSRNLQDQLKKLYNES